MTPPPMRTSRCGLLLLCWLLLAATWSATALASGLTLRFVDAGSGEPVSDVVVVAVSPSEPNPVKAEIEQRDRQFRPGVLTVPVGSTVDFPNRDDTQHHVYSFSPAKPFELKLYADRPEAPIRFDTTGVVELGCNIHDHMQGFVLVTEAVQSWRSGAAGLVTLPSPKAPLTLRYWHRRLPDNTRFQPLTLGEPLPAHHRIALELQPPPPANTALDRLQQRFREL
ncbi:MAG: methylamine utilization protein [Pseudomonadales bacterium]|nr:methylamine utilization protein [Pseudomonadales bacterium]